MHFATKFCSIFCILLLTCSAAIASTLQQPSSTAKKIRESPQDITQLILEGRKVPVSLIKTGPLTSLGKKFNAWNKSLEQTIGLSLGLTYIPLFQYASISSDKKLAGAGDFDFYGQWQIFHQSQRNRGYLGFAFENRHHLAPITPVELSNQIGALWRTVSSFNVQSLALIQLWWQQYLFNKHLMFRLGKIDQTSFFDVNEFQTNELYFLNSSLADNPAIAFPANGLGGIAGISFDGFYLLAGLGDADAEKTSLNYNTFYDGRESFQAIEIGYDPKKNSFGEDNHHITLWRVERDTNPMKPAGYGATISLQHRLNKHIIPFVRFSYAEKKVLALKELLSGGIIIDHPFNSKVSILGFGAAYGIPTADVRSQYITECFYRIQVTPNIQLTPDLQLIFNPLRSDAHNPVFVAGLRTRIFL